MTEDVLAVPLFKILFGLISGEGELWDGGISVADDWECRA